MLLHNIYYQKRAFNAARSNSHRGTAGFAEPIALGIGASRWPLSFALGIDEVNCPARLAPCSSAFLLV